MISPSLDVSQNPGAFQATRWQERPRTKLGLDRRAHGVGYMFVAVALEQFK